MSSSNNSLRVVAVAVALFVAVLTGTVTGLLSGAPDCPAAPAAAPAQTTAPATAATGAAATGDPGGGAPEPPRQARTTGPAAAPAAAPALAQVAVCTNRETFGVTAALVAFVGTLLVGAALLLLLLLSTRDATRRAGAGNPAKRGTGTGGAADADRRTLVQACIYVRDRVTSKALGDRLGAALHDAGVTTVEPTGVRFDPAHHEAGGAAPCNDPALIGSIAAVEVPGYIDRDGRVLRAPIVTVYQAARNGGSATGAHPTVQPRREQQR